MISQFYVKRSTITAVGNFRASHYLRAMAIWGIYGVLLGWEK
ncbi:MAG: hypothetical protein QNJ32_19550 [Xenococcaceae cyanobacterium MO_167.B27]|nr:hypothetical protein [Xenococcaceae cyanobacterium MO_167.B27]